MCETMGTGRVICVLPREIVGNSTSALLPRRIDTLNVEKIWAEEQRSVRFGVGSRQERAGKKSNDRQQ